MPGGGEWVAVVIVREEYPKRIVKKLVARSALEAVSGREHIVSNGIFKPQYLPSLGGIQI